MCVVSAFPCQSRFFSPPFRKDLKNAAIVTPRVDSVCSLYSVVQYVNF